MSSAPAVPGIASRDRAFFVFTAVVSAVALAVIAWILMFRDAAPGGRDLSFMPAVNAALNASASALLVIGWVAIRRGERRMHKFVMVSAFACSGLFLAGYLAYHWIHGDTRYQGTGALRTIYFVVLATHVLLSTTVLPCALLAFWFAARKRFDLHRRMNRVFLPVWLYVSVTGVAIYFLLRADQAP
jgi:putative membrane protein